MSDDLPSPEVAMHMLQGAIGQINFAREYVLELLDATPKDLWFRIPDGLPTNIAWQVGHLAVSQYGLLAFRIRGRRTEDLELIPSRFRKTYGRGTVARADPADQPSPDEFLDRMARVHELAMGELAEVTAETLLEPVQMPFAAYPVKLGAILFCPLHEHIHAGQIGLLRRAMNLEPVR